MDRPTRFNVKCSTIIFALVAATAFTFAAAAAATTTTTTTTASTINTQHRRPNATNIYEHNLEFGDTNNVNTALVDVNSIENSEPDDAAGDEGGGGDAINVDNNANNDKNRQPKLDIAAGVVVAKAAAVEAAASSLVNSTGTAGMPDIDFVRNRRASIEGPRQLINEKQCPEIRNLCSNLREGTDDLPVLECVQTFLSNQIETLSDECQHAIWSHTTELIGDASVLRIVQKPCSAALKSLNVAKAGDMIGSVLAKLIDQKDEIKQTACVTLINRLEAVAFSDFRLVAPFVRDCSDDIEQKACGRFHLDRNVLSQGETLACLQSQIADLTPACKKGIMHLSELQSDNVKLDRPLFLACNNEVARFCAESRPGQIYKCLLLHKNDEKMSATCQEQLLRRYKIIAHDYKVSKGLARSCKEDIKLNHCRRGVSEDKDVRLAQILLCLEAAHKNNTRIAPECLAEISDHRKLLMEDYQMSPEILSDCADDITKFCNDLDAGGGKTIHCLMENARPKRKKDRRVTAVCQRALEMLVKVSDIGEDWRVDPVLRNACKAVVDVACSEVDGGDARVMSCLMEKINTKYMKPDCEAALLQIQYFVARDFKLEPQLYRACKDDAIRICHAKKSWAEINPSSQMDPERGPMILPCLYRYAYHPDKNLQLQPACLQEIKYTMRRRAISVDLLPEVEDECIDDLAALCFEKTEKGEEMQCLQENLNKLQDGCKKAVAEFTENQASDIELNPIIMTYCRGAMKRYCDKVSGDNGDMMECLISHKNDPEMRQDAKCRAALEHFQIISLQNYHFTYKFKEACRPYVIRFCPTSNTKNDVVACLSEVIRNDTLKSQRHTIPKECRQQVRAQLFQQRENVDFDPKLKSVCRTEIKEICSAVQHGAGQVLECLQTNSERLGSECRHVIFSIKKSELTDSATDYMLITTCREMINQYCHDTDKSKVLDCLKVHKDELMFDQSCHLIVINRMIEQNMDYRFNPRLQEACSKNIADYCTKIVATEKQNEELNGKVVNCLKAKFREGKLTTKCVERMTEVLHEQALNYKLNPLLQTVCKSEIEIICNSPNEDVEDREDHGQVEECLKMAFVNHKIFSNECKYEVALLIQEAKADIHVDPLLQRACMVDLLKYCSNVPSGNGRQLRCLQTILADQSKALDGDCKLKLEKRMEMYSNAAPYIQPPEDLGQLYSQVVTSPSKKFFFLVLMSFVGFIFIIGLFCGRVTRRTIALKNK